MFEGFCKNIALSRPNGEKPAAVRALSTDATRKVRFQDAGPYCGGDLQHLISDAATMQIIRWTDGGFGMLS